MRIEIQSPCPIQWKGSDVCGKSLFCHQCAKKVHHLSNMTPAEARVIVARKDEGEGVCVSFVADESGNVVFKRRVASMAVAAAAVFYSPVAAADGSTVVLVPAQTVAPIEQAPETGPEVALDDEAANTDAVDVGALPAAALIDVEDTDCASKNVDVALDPDGSEAGTLEIGDEGFFVFGGI